MYLTYIRELLGHDYKVEWKQCMGFKPFKSKNLGSLEYIFLPQEPIFAEIAAAYYLE